MTMEKLPRQIFAGAALRELRLRRGLRQRELAADLGVSTSYLSQMESDDRPITTAVLDALAGRFAGEWAIVDAVGAASVIVGALKAAADPSVPMPLPTDAAVQRTLSRHPAIARRLIAMHEAIRRGEDHLRALDDRVEADEHARTPLPWQEVRDWFSNHRNYIDPIDRAAERTAVLLDADAPIASLAALLRGRFGVEVVTATGDHPPLRTFDSASRTLRLDPAQAPETTAFSLAYQLARSALPEEVHEVARTAKVSEAARRLLSAGLANYAAGALLMPYVRFRSAAREVRHDVDRLRRRFGVSFEQACHRLSNLQRPGVLGVPFFFCRMDMAGNITKRHSATRLQFAQFGGSCPLWNVHEAVAIPDRIMTQLVETPDGVRYISMARGLVKFAGSIDRPPRRYAVALGCEVEHAAEFVYADGIRLDGGATPIGTSCRICSRRECEQRAFPPAAAPISLDLDSRGAVPYSFRTDV